jgi:hypothetical protein
MGYILYIICFICLGWLIINLFQRVFHSEVTLGKVIFIFGFNPITWLSLWALVKHFN